MPLFLATKGGLVIAIEPGFRMTSTDQYNTSDANTESCLSNSDADGGDKTQGNTENVIQHKHTGLGST